MAVVHRVSAPAPARLFGPPLPRNQRLALGAAGFVFVLVAWEVAARLGVLNPLFFSKPTDIVIAGINEVQLPRFWNDVSVSLTEFSVGLVLAILLGIPLGLISGWYPRFLYFIDPWLNFLNATPRVALLPIIVIWLGLGVSSKIAVVFLGAFFSILIPTIQGVRTVDKRLVDVARSFRASRRLLFTSVILPGTVPFIVTGLKIGVARALLGVVVGELYAATSGLGVMISKASQVLQADRMFFGVFIFTIAGVLGVGLVGRVETYFQRWRPRQGTR